MIKRNILLNPGPATTTDSVKRAQVVPDICHREREFCDLMRSVQGDLIRIAGGDEESYACVMFTGSGTAAMEAVVSSIIPEGKKLLVINNGVYGERFGKIADAYRIGKVELKFGWDETPDLEIVRKSLEDNVDISHIVIVHHETTTGLLNPLEEISQLAGEFEKGFIVDAVSSFAGLPLDVKKQGIDFTMSTSNKCIQGMPGISFVIGKKSKIEELKDRSKRSFYLDLYGQYVAFRDKGETPFTPAIQTTYALRQAIDEFFEEGAENRFRRYQESHKTLREGLNRMGFEFLLKEKQQSGILLTVKEPKDRNYSFQRMHDLLYERGYTIYPGKMSNVNTFRLANLGDIDSGDIKNFLGDLKEVLDEMGVNLSNEKS